VTGTSYLGSVTLNADNITVNNVVSKDGNLSFFNSSGSEKMRIVQNGNVGIGTTSPNTLLHVYAVSNPSIQLQSGATGGGDFEIKSPDAGSRIDFNAGAGGSNLMTFNITSGNVGIGTIAPNAKLQINGPRATTFGKDLHTSITGGGGYTNDYVQLGIGYTTGATIPPVIIAAKTVLQTGQTTADLIFATRPNHTGVDAPQERMRITADGNVGIGTTSPDSLLHVQGGDIAINTSTGEQKLRFRNDAGQWFIMTDDSGGGDIGFGTLGIWDGTTGGTGAVMVFQNKTGNVGIGETSPTSTLHVLNNLGTGETARFRNDASNAQTDVSIVNDVQTWGFRVDGGDGDKFKIVDFQDSSEDITIQTDGKVGIGNTVPNATLHVSGAVVGGQATISSDTDALDATGVNSVRANTVGNSITIGGLANGVAGQVVHIMKIHANNDLIIESVEGVGQDIYTPDAADITCGTYGGVTIVFDGNLWWVVSEACT
jgi:hypothetical protein